MSLPEEKPKKEAKAAASRRAFEPEKTAAKKETSQRAKETDENPEDERERPTTYRPTSAEIEEEIRVRKRRKNFWRILATTLFTMMCVAAAAILLATQFFPTLKIYGSSMVPALKEGEIAVSVKSSSFKTGDVVAFYYNNKLLVKRVICGPGDWFNMQEDGTVYVNGNRLDEPYIEELSFGQCDLELPYQVPEEHYFLMGDQRESSVDSRLSQVGCIAGEQIVGRIVFCVWPLGSIRAVR